MNCCVLKKSLFLFVSLVMVLLFLRIILNASFANSLGQTYLFLETMRTSSSTDFVLMITPNGNFNDMEEDRILRIFFPAGETGEEEWCLDDGGSLVVNALSESPVDVVDWEISEGLPGILEASCYRGEGGGNDFIEITGIDALSGGVSYGLEIEEQETVFRTGANSGGNTLYLQLMEGSKVETIAFEINLLDSDEIIVDAYIAESHTINCYLGENVNLGTFFLGGPYVTGSHGFGTESSGSGFYWAVYGENQGLAHSTEPYVLSSLGVEGVVDLISGEGLGLVINSSTLGTIQPNYLPTTPGFFGSVDSEGKLILQSDSPGSGSYTATLGARASVEAPPGAYQETLTYICGAYVGGELEFACYIEQGNYTQPISFEDNLLNFMVDCNTGYDWETVSASVLKDNVTGLYWSEASPTTVNYSDAVNHCDNLTLEGRTDWRLPTKDELMQIAPANIDFDYGEPWVCDGCYSGNDMYAYDSVFATENYFWAVNQVEEWVPVEYWALMLEDGDLMPRAPDNDASNHVRCVSRD